MKILPVIWPLVFSVIISVIATLGSATVWPKVLLLGDGFVETCFAVTSPWCSSLADNLIRVCDVVNRGAYEYNSRSYLAVLNKAMKETVAKDVALVILFIGTIDAYDPKKMPTLSVPLDEFRSNLRDIIEAMDSMGIPKSRMMLINGPPSYSYSKAFRGDKAAALYGNSTIEVAKQFKVSWIDLRVRMAKDYKTQDKWSALFENEKGLFNSKGSAYFFKVAWPVIQIKLKDYMESDFLSKNFPLYSSSG